MALALHILVGTMTGNAQLVAQEIELAFGDDDVIIDTTLMDNLDAGVFALGDRTHVGTFCDGGRHFDEALAAAGAQRIGEVARHDASGGTLAEDEALEWFPQWLELARQRVAQA